jgi:hypothetical protein
MKIRHCFTAAGKDVFDDWLTELGDARAQAKIATRINRPETSATASLYGRDYTSGESIGGQTTACITR